MNANSIILSDEYSNYAENAYPSNHTYQLRNNALVPKRDLAKRHHVIKKLYPTPLTSLLDVSSSKGFFVFDAARESSCTRALGIDVNDYDIVFSNAVKQCTNAERASFARLTLRELADRIDAFGGPFQTVLLINSYQYFYFGSDTSPDSYHNHTEIFQHLSRVCSHRIIFNNRVNLEDCQNRQQVQNNPDKAAHYSRLEIFAAASLYFNVKEHGKIGKYPLWTLDVK